MDFSITARRRALLLPDPMAAGFTKAVESAGLLARLRLYRAVPEFALSLPADFV
jgi:hypothetical protein